MSCHREYRYILGTVRVRGGGTTCAMSLHVERMKCCSVLSK